jgi:hypothetical protein
VTALSHWPSHARSSLARSVPAPERLRGDLGVFVADFLGVGFDVLADVDLVVEDDGFVDEDVAARAVRAEPEPGSPDVAVLLTRGTAPELASS